MPDYAQLVKLLVHEDSKIRESARKTLMAIDEAAVDPLLDEFYAGVTDAQGVAILDVIAEIGGPDAMSTLRNTFHFEETRKALKNAAARGLRHNGHSLSPKEVVEVENYLADNAGYSSSSIP